MVVNDSLVEEVVQKEYLPQKCFYTRLLCLLINLIFQLFNLFDSSIPRSQTNHFHQKIFPELKDLTQCDHLEVQLRCPMSHVKYSP